VKEDARMVVEREIKLDFTLERAGTIANTLERNVIEQAGLPSKRKD